MHADSYAAMTIAADLLFTQGSKYPHDLADISTMILYRALIWVETRVSTLLFIARKPQKANINPVSSLTAKPVITFFAGNLLLDMNNVFA